jgi:prepilin-type N-terminal cleavage/methylation domain-containing protein
VRPSAERGFTLVEAAVALAIAGALLAIVLGGLRVGLAAWSRAEARAIELDHARGVVDLLERALDGVAPYRLAAEPGRSPRILFDGGADRLAFVTLTPPLPVATTIAFTAVEIAVGPEGLALRQQALPDRLALDRLAPELVDPSTRAARFRYLGEEPEAWRDEWDAAREDALPRAVELTVVTGSGRAERRERLVLPIRATVP